MNSEIKLPTLLALTILLTGIIIGVYSISQNQVLSTKADESAVPEKIEVDNISEGSASIAWQTAREASSFVSFGKTVNLGDVSQDERDAPNPLPHSLHLVTLNNLTPNTTYYFKITSGRTSYPDQPLTFKTSNIQASLGYQPLIGTVLDNNLQPVKEAFIKLQVPGAQDLITITHGNGSFILPLSQIKNKDLTENFIIAPETTANLTVFNLSESSKITLILPYQNKLPTITLGKDLNLNVPALSPTTSPVLGISKVILNSSDFDFNNDKKITSKDLSLLLGSISKQPLNLKYDLNGDNKIDEMDIEIFKEGLKQANL